MSNKPPTKFEEYLNKTKKVGPVKKTIESPKKGMAKINGFILLIALIIILVSNGTLSPNPTMNADTEAFEEYNSDRGTISMVPVTIYSSTTCDCCHEYVDYLSDLGFEVNFMKDDVRYLEVKIEFNIPSDQTSCHTAVIQGFFSEGHIPASVLYDLINEQPEIDGISLAGMPSGSPGMPGDQSEDWNIYSILNGEVLEIFRTID